MVNKKSILRNFILFGLSLGLMIAALYMVFIYVPTEKNMGVVQRIFYFHVPIAWVAFLAFFIVFIGSIMYLWKRDMKWDRWAHTSAEVGVIFTTLVLITGSIWAKPIWGIWWTWDARLTASLVLWLIYIAYLLLRSYANEQAQGARIAAVLGIIGFIDVPIVALAINIWRTQHPPALIFEGGLGTPGLITLLVSIAAFTLLYILLVSCGITLKNQQEEISRLKDVWSEQGG